MGGGRWSVGGVGALAATGHSPLKIQNFFLNNLFFNAWLFLRPIENLDE